MDETKVIGEQSGQPAKLDPPKSPPSDNGRSDNGITSELVAEIVGELQPQLNELKQRLDTLHQRGGQTSPPVSDAGPWFEKAGFYVGVLSVLTTVLLIWVGFQTYSNAAIISGYETEVRGFASEVKEHGDQVNEYSENLQRLRTEDLQLRADISEHMRNSSEIVESASREVEQLHGEVATAMRIGSESHRAMSALTRGHFDLAMGRHHFALQASEESRKILLEVAKEIRDPTTSPLHDSIQDLIAATWALEGAASWEASVPEFPRVTASAKELLRLQRDVTQAHFLNGLSCMFAASEERIDLAARNAHNDEAIQALEMCLSTGGTTRRTGHPALLYLSFVCLDDGRLEDAAKYANEFMTSHPHTSDEHRLDGRTKARLNLAAAWSHLAYFQMTPNIVHYWASTCGDWTAELLPSEGRICSSYLDQLDGDFTKVIENSQLSQEQLEPYMGARQFVRDFANAIRLAQNTCAAPMDAVAVPYHGSAPPPAVENAPEPPVAPAN